MDKAALERRLSRVEGFAAPKLELEQYATPADLAAHLVHLADLQGDLVGKTVVDLGTGTGMLALGAACRDPARVLALDRDPDALAQARENERAVADADSSASATASGTSASATASGTSASATAVEWLRADATRAPLCVSSSGRAHVTVLTNPPFGAQTGNEHADRAFLSTASEIAGVSYSIHNAGSRDFVEAFAADEGGAVTHAVRAELDLPRQYAHQTSERETVDAEVFRIEWDA